MKEIKKRAQEIELKIQENLENRPEELLYTKEQYNEAFNNYCKLVYDIKALAKSSESQEKMNDINEAFKKNIDLYGSHKENKYTYTQLSNRILLLVELKTAINTYEYDALYKEYKETKEALKEREGVEKLEDYNNLFKKRVDLFGSKSNEKNRYELEHINNRINSLMSTKTESKLLKQSIENDLFNPKFYPNNPSLQAFSEAHKTSLSENIDKEYPDISDSALKNYHLKRGTEEPSKYSRNSEEDFKKTLKIKTDKRLSNNSDIKDILAQHHIDISLVKELPEFVKGAKLGKKDTTADYSTAGVFLYEQEGKTRTIYGLKNSISKVDSQEVDKKRITKVKFNSEEILNEQKNYINLIRKDRNSADILNEKSSYVQRMINDDSSLENSSKTKKQKTR